ncbi:protein of unknown function [Stenotrophomonas maltophilia]|nr:protein of unknown function [Stenotrophomonas maltophilia]
MARDGSQLLKAGFALAPKTLFNSPSLNFIQYLRNTKLVSIAHTNCNFIFYDDPKRPFCIIDGAM